MNPKPGKIFMLNISQASRSNELLQYRIIKLEA
jgi:hypothetical protein